MSNGSDNTYHENVTDGHSVAVPSAPRFGADNPNYKGGRSRLKSAYTARYRLRYPDRAIARHLVQIAVATGELVKPAECAMCLRASDEPLHGHHDDYTKPLDVVWLCRSCHLDLHRRGVHIRPAEVAAELQISARSFYRQKRDGMFLHLMTSSRTLSRAKFVAWINGAVFTS